MVVCDPELTRKVLLDDHTFDKGGPLYERVRDLLGNGLGKCPHQLHRRQRRLCQPAFQRERLRAYVPVMAAETQSAIDSWQDGEVIDVPREMMKLTARAAVATMFSSTLPSAAVDLVVADFTPDRSVIALRRAEPGEDGSRLTALPEGGVLLVDTTDAAHALVGHARQAR